MVVVSKNASSPGSAKKTSPKRKLASAIRVTPDDMKQKRKASYTMKIMKLLPDFEIIWVDGVPGNDGWVHPLCDYVTNHGGFRDEGMLCAARRRTSQADNNVLTNTNNSYARRCVVRLVEESTHDSRLAILRVCQAFLRRPENNRFNYDYIVGETSDLTPVTETELLPMDHVLQNDVIVTIICAVFDDTDGNWYGNNLDTVHDFFTGPTFPDYAINQLGYPSNVTDRNGSNAPHIDND
jgi:hypothetical protein